MSTDRPSVAAAISGINTTISSNTGTINNSNDSSAASEARASAARSQQQIAQSMVSASQSKVDSLRSELSPPPTIQVPDGKSSRTEVDQREVARINKELSNASAKLQHAQAKVNESSTESASATDEQKASESVSTLTASENQTLQAQVDSFTEFLNSMNPGQLEKIDVKNKEALQERLDTFAIALNNSDNDETNNIDSAKVTDKESVKLFMQTLSEISSGKEKDTTTGAASDRQGS